MNGLAILLICAVLTTASSLATCHQLFNPIYLEFTHLPDDGTSIQSTYNVLHLISVRARGNKDLISTAIHDVMLSQGFNLSHSAFLAQLMLLNQGISEITPPMVISLMKICRALSQIDRGLEIFIYLLRNRGPRMFNLENVMRSIGALSENTYEFNMVAERNLDLLLNRVFSLGKPNDDLSVENLENLDLTTEKCNTRALSRIPLKVSLHGGVEGKDVIDLFIDSMKELCQGLMDGPNRRFHLDVITLAHTFGVTSDEFPPQVKKLKEYNRLCASVNRSEEVIKENLRISFRSQGQSSSKGQKS